MTGLNNGRKTSRCISNVLQDRTKTKTRIKTKTRTRIKIKAKTEPARLFSTTLSMPGRNQGEKPCAQSR